MVRVVVLLGPPGSGKSSIGGELARRGFRWREWELWILERWGTRDEFLRSKATTLPELHAAIRRWISSESTTAVIESTGFSDAPLLDDLDAAGETFVVRLDVPERVALSRVAEREPGRHLSDDVEQNRAIWHACSSVTASRRADLIIDTLAVSVPSAAAQIEEAVRGEQLDWR